MEGATCIEQARSTCVNTSEFDGRFNAFAAGAAEESLGHRAASQTAEALGQFARAFGDVALQHGRTFSIELVLQCVNNVRMIVASVVGTITRQEVQDSVAISCEQLSALAECISNIHL
jgi:hypothetical protein